MMLKRYFGEFEILREDRGNMACDQGCQMAWFSILLIGFAKFKFITVQVVIFQMIIESLRR